MEDDEDVVAPRSSEQQPLLEPHLDQPNQPVQQCDTVFPAGDVPEIPPPVPTQGVVEPSPVGEGDAAGRDEREGVVEDDTGLKLEGDGDVNVAEEEPSLPVVEFRDELVEDREERVISGEDVEVPIPESEGEVANNEAEPMSLPVVEVREEELAGREERVISGEGVEVPGPESEGEVAGNEIEPMSIGEDVVELIPENKDEVADDKTEPISVVAEVDKELAGEGEGVEAEDREDKVENFDERIEKRDEVTGDEGQVSELVEAVERESKDTNVEEAKAMEEEVMKVEDLEPVTEKMEVRNEETVDKMDEEEEKEAPTNTNEVERDIVEEVPLVKEEEMAEKEREATATAIEVKVDGAVNAEEVVQKDDEMAGEETEATLCANEVEGDEVVGAEAVSPVNEEVQLVDEKSKAVNMDDLAEDKGEKDGVGKELEVEEEVEGVAEEGSKGEEEEEEEAEDMDHSPGVTVNDEAAVEEGTPIGDTEMETEAETVKSGSGSGGKRKRVAKAKPVTPVKTPSRKIVGEDVCFICLDGGDLVLCDRRGCPKAYHPTCVDHDDEFFKTKGRWNCGWHLCNKCGKNAYFMCYTCQFSMCKSCSKDADIFCVRANKGFCESCMKTIMVIENRAQNETGHDAFSDKSSWEYLFKDYWLEQKERLGFTSEELSQAKNPWKHSDKQQTSVEVHEGNNDAGGDTDNSLDKNASSGKRKSRRRLKSQAKEVFSDSENSSPDASSRRGKKARRLAKSRSRGIDYGAPDMEWASKELLEFVMHMKNGDQSVLTQFDVQGLLLEYIKRNKLRDPRRQSQILCDSMLQKLFGKPRVGHFEMLKLLESHFFLKDNSHTEDNQGSIGDTEMRQLDADDNTDSPLDGGKSRGRKSRKRGDERGSQSNLDEYAAIDMHNINLIFLRRNLMEALMENSEAFHDKAIGSFVRIRISGSGQKQDIYRLVQIMGTSKAAEPYKVGKRMTDAMLEILNLDKTETISIDIISNQEFSEDECKRLRQSIKCGLINRMTVGDVLEKARELHEIRVIDWLEAEIVRLSHLRDRASEKGRKKELRECVEKLQLLKTPEERQRRLDEIPEVHADPKMDPSCESEDEMDTTRQVNDARPREAGFTRRGRDQFSSRKGGSTSSDSWSANARPPNQKWEPSRSSSGKDLSGGREDTVFTSPTREHSWSNGVDKGTPRSNSWEKPRMISDSSLRAGHSVVRSDLSAVGVSESPRMSSVAGQTDLKESETEKMWHYRDPAGKVQGPFSMTQLRKWSNTGYFPTDLKIWRISQTENDSMLLTDCLAGKFDKEMSNLKTLPSPIDTSKISGGPRSSATGGRYEFSNLPSPTPGRNSFQSSNQLRGGIERLPSPTPTTPSDPIGVGRSNFSHQSKGVAAGNRGESIAASVVQPAAMQHSYSTSGPRPDLSSTSGAGNGLHITPQAAVHMGAQPVVAHDSMNQSNLAQGLSNIHQPGAGQNPSVYTHGWSSGYAARPETGNASMTPSNTNGVPAQVAYAQWTTASVSNQAQSYGAVYAGSGNVATNMAGMPAQNAWRPAATNMPWGGQQQQIVNQNMVWAGPPAGGAFAQASGMVPGAMGQQGGPTVGASTMPGGNTTSGWSGAGPSPAAGSTNPGWAPPQGNTGGRGSDQNRNGGGGHWNRQSSFGSGGQRVCKFHETGHCKKGAACDYMHG